QWTGNGGFSAWGGNRLVNLGGAAVPSTVTWGTGGFVPTGSQLVFSNGGSSLATGSVVFQNPIVMGGAVRTIQVGDGAAVVDAQLTGLLSFSTGGGLSKTGAGSLLLPSGSNNGSGVTTAVSAGLLLLPDMTALPGSDAGRTLTLTSSGGASLLGAVDPAPLLARIATASTGVLALDATVSTPTNSFAVSLDMSSFTGLSLGAHSANTTNNTMGNPVYFSGTILPQGSTYRLNSTANRTVGAANGALGSPYNTLVLNAPGILSGASNGAVLPANGGLVLMSWNDLGGPVTSAVGASNAIAIGNDAALGTSPLTFTSNQPGFGSILGDHVLNNNITATAASSWFLMGDLGSEGIPLAGRGLLTFGGTVDLGSANNRNIYTRNANAAPVTFLGDVRAAQVSLGLSNSTGGNYPVSMLANAAITPGATPKSFTSIVQSANNILVIDSDRSLGAVPGSATTSLTLNSSVSNAYITGPSLWLMPGSGQVVLHPNRNVVMGASSAPAIQVGLGDELVISGSVSGAASQIYKTGGGSLTLRGGNSFTGGLQILGGTLRLDYANLNGAAPIIQSAVGLTLASTSTNGGQAALLIQSGATAVSQSFAGVTLNPKQLEIQLAPGAGSLLVNLGAITRSSVGSALALTVSGGTLQTSSGSASSLLTDSSGVAYATYNLNDWAAKDASNTQIVPGSSLAGFYTASTASSLSGNADVVGNDPALAGALSVASLRFNQAAARAVSVSSGGVLTLGGVLVGANVGANAVTISGAGSIQGIAGRELVVVQNNLLGDLTISSVIANNSSATALVKAGPGTLILSGANTFSGNLILNAGTLSVASVNNINSSGVLGNVSSQSGSTFLFNGGNFRYTGSTSATTDRAASFNGVSSIEVTAASGTLMLGNSANAISGVLGVPGILRKLGAGALTLGNASTNTNLSVDVLSGTLWLAKSAGSGAVDQAGGASLLIGNGANATITGSGNQIGDTSSVVVRAGGLLNLNGFSEGFDGLSGGGTVSSTAAATLTLGLNHDAAISAYSVAASLAGMGSTGLNAFSGTIGGSIALVKSGVGTQILAGRSTYSGQTTITSGVLMAGTSNVLPFGAGAGSVLLSSTLSGGLSVPGVFDLGGYNQTLNGLNAAVPSGQQSYPVVTNTPLSTQADNTVATVFVGSNDSTSSFAGSFQDGFRVLAGTTPVGIRGRLALNKIGTGTFTVAGPGEFSGGTTLSAGTLSLGHSSALGIAGTITFAGGTLQYGSGVGTDYSARFATVSNQAYRVDTNGQDVTFAGTLASSGATLSKFGQGMLTLAGSNTWTGGVELYGGTLAVSNPGGLNAAAPLAVNFVGGGEATLRVAGNAVAVSGLNTAPQWTGSAVVENGAATGGTLTVSNASAGAFSGTLRDGPGGGALSLVKSGSGRLVLGGVGTYSGPTVVQSGALTFSGSYSGSGAWSVGSGAVLGGSGSIASTVTVQSGGSLAPGGGVTLSLGGLAIQGGGTLNFALGTPQASDRVLVLGSNQLILGGGTLNVAVLGGGRAVAGTYTLIDYAGVALNGSQFSQISLASAVLGTNALSISLVNNTANTSIDLWVAAESRVWSGAGGNGGVWNLNSGSNWVGNTSFFNGDRVLFDDSATGSSTVLLNNADGALAPSEIVVNNTARNYVFTGSGAIAGAGTLTKQGAGNLTLATSNTFSGGVQLQAGRLILANAQALGTGALTITGGSLDSAVSDLNLTSNNAQVWAADFGFGGTQNLNLGTGGVLLSGGTRAVWVGGGVLTVGGAIGDGGAAFGLSKTGTGTLVLGGSSTFGGGLRVQAGAVRALHSNALGVPGAGVQVDAGASLELSGGIALNPGSLTVAGSGAGAGAGAIRSLSGLNTVGSPVRMASDTLVAVDAGVLNLTGALSGSAKLSKSGSGVLTLSGNHVAGYSGGTDVLQGVLALLRPEALPATGVVNVSGSGATLSFGMGGTGGFSAEQISATLASPQVVLGTGAGVGIDTSLASAAVVYATELNLGSRAFSKSGAEMLTLSGNTVFGDLRILAGTLRFGTGGVGGAPGSGAIRVDSGAVMLVDRGVTTSLSQTVSGAGSLSLAGGLLELGNAANTLSGGIRLEGGTLSFVDGALGTAPVTVAGSAALRWNGGAADVSMLNGLRVADGQTLTLEVGSAAVTL
ncbi:MAG: hypothetical protein RLZZ399_2831, partial [Verrucomicrobiota bacterium]